MTARAVTNGSFVREFLLSTAKRFPSRGTNFRKTFSAGITELFTSPYQIAQLLITGAFVKYTISKFDFPEVFNITKEHVQARVDHYSNILNWTLEDFTRLPDQKEKEMVLQSLFPVILENTLAAANVQLHFERTLLAHTDGQQSCEVCLTESFEDFHVTLPESNERFQCCGGKCYACVRNREVAELSRFIDRDRSFWLLNKYGDSISLVNAASSAYSTMVMRVQLEAAHQVKTVQEAELAISTDDANWGSKLSAEEMSYFDSLAAFSHY